MPTQHDRTAFLSSLQWVKALTFDLSTYNLCDLLQLVNEYKEFGWCIHLPGNSSHEVGNMSCMSYDLELIGQQNTKLELTEKLTMGFSHGLCIRNAHFIENKHAHFIRGKYDIFNIDNCVFDGYNLQVILSVECSRLSITNCTFKSHGTGIKFELMEKDEFDAPMILMNDVLVNVCNNRFENCNIPMNLKLGTCDVKNTIIQNNVTD